LFPVTGIGLKTDEAEIAGMPFYLIWQALIMKRLSVAMVFLLAVCEVFSQIAINPTAINIVRDKWGVPHIFGRTDPEVAYGLAWAHAEDDFETIQKTLLASKAMLGQYSGRDGAIVDYAVHLLGIRQLVDAKYETAISQDFKSVLEGYCEGLNAFARTHPKEILLKRSFPATPQDLISYSILQLALGCGVEAELKKIFHGTVPLAQWEPQGSNAFAFNSKKTSDGNVFLAINTHHPLESQVSWYEAHLSSEEGWNIAGALFPGSPVIFTGINENLGWTHTVNHPDRLDVYQLEMNPDNNLQYKVDGIWYNLEESTVKLRIKVPGFNLHLKRKAYRSIYGPTLITDRGVFSIRTPAIMDIRGLEQWYRMNKAKNFHEFRKALSMESHPGYNIMYGDRYDTIYYLSNGRLPLRDPAYNWLQTLPGNTARTLWTEFHPISDLPQLINPSSGYLFNTNHSPFKPSAPADNLVMQSYDPTMGYETLDNNRSLRVTELLAELSGDDQNRKISFDEFKKIKYDLQLPKQLAYPVNLDNLFLLDEKEFPHIADVITTLRRWDRKATVENEGATVFAIMFYWIAEKYQADPGFTFLSRTEAVQAMEYARDYLLTYFGKINVPLGEYQRLERGDRSLPLPGLPDVLATMYSTCSENGRVKGTIGECYVALVNFTKEGPQIQTVNCFGASNRKKSVHYSDQMELFQNQKTKEMSIREDVVYRNAKTVYHPEVLMKLTPTARLTRARR
jgi:acyl-homoserine-lactone acylase